MPTLNAAPSWRSDANGWPRSPTTGGSRSAGTSPATSAYEPRRTGTAPPEPSSRRARRNPHPRLRWPTAPPVPRSSAPGACGPALRSMPLASPSGFVVGLILPRAIRPARRALSQIATARAARVRPVPPPKILIPPLPPPGEVVCLRHAIDSRPWPCARVAVQAWAGRAHGRCAPCRWGGARPSQSYPASPAWRPLPAGKRLR